MTWYKFAEIIVSLFLQNQYTHPLLFWKKVRNSSVVRKKNPLVFLAEILETGFARMNSQISDLLSSPSIS